jgi:hypothetical protein
VLNWAYRHWLETAAGALLKQKGGANGRGETGKEEKEEEENMIGTRGEDRKEAKGDVIAMRKGIICGG